jgi:hypothetical protein
MKRLVWIMTLTVLLAACAPTPSDHNAPVIGDITTSNKVFAISDCQNTSVTITAKVTDGSNITQVQLWYRVNREGPFASLPMKAENDQYSAEVKGADLQGGGYGVMEFYITAQDEAGNKSESPPDTSVQFLPCVSS